MDFNVHAKVRIRIAGTIALNNYVSLSKKLQPNLLTMEQLSRKLEIYII
jgi:hypothetical protein